MPPSQEESKNKPGRFNRLTLDLVKSEVEKYELDLLIKSENIRDLENPNIDVSMIHVQKAKQDINKKHVLEALSEFESSKSKSYRLQIVIIILLVANILLTFRDKIHPYINSFILTFRNKIDVYINIISERYGLINFLIVILLLINITISIFTNKKSQKD